MLRLTQILDIVKVRLWLAAVVFSLVACASDEEAPVATGQATIQISLSAWQNAATRAGGTMIYPINVLLVPQGSNEVHKAVTVASGTQFGVSVPNGTYDIYAVCGLPTSSIPALLSTSFTIPRAAEGGQVDFAVGSVSVTAQNGVCTPADIQIGAERKMAWMDVKLLNVPASIVGLKLYVKGLSETYSLDEGWHITQAGTKRFTQIPLTQNATVQGTYEGSLITPPCASATGVTYYVEAMTASGYSTLLEYTSQTPIRPGEHRMENIAYSDLTIVAGDVSLGDWNDVSDGGTLATGTEFTYGDQYFAYPATVYYIIPNADVTFPPQYHIFPHLPMTATLNEVRAWTDFMHVDYPHIAAPSVANWAFPKNDVSPRNLLSFMSYLASNGSSFNALIQAAGSEPIDMEATNILAYYDAASDTFYRYDFRNFTLVPVPAGATGRFLIYPTGIVNRPQ